MLKPSTGVRAAGLWVFAVALSGALRYAVVTVWDVWTTDGRLAVSPAAFAAINAMQLAAAGALFLWLYYPSERRA